MDSDTQKDVSKLIPKVYEDALKPSVIHIGKSIEETVKITLRPYNGLIWSLDKCMDWLVSTISKKVESRRIQKIQKPTTETTLKVLQGLQTTGVLKDSIPRNLFANLLLTEMDPESTYNSHPSYAEILKQLTSFECRMLCVIANRPLTIVSTSTIHNHKGPYKYLGDVGYHNESHDLKEKCEFPPNFELDLYISNLERVGILTTSVNFYKDSDSIGSKEESGIYRREIELFNEHIRKFKDHSDCPTSATVTITILRTTSFGHAFLRAIDAIEFYDQENEQFRTEVN